MLQKSNNTTQRRGMATNANTAFHIGHPGLATVAKTMTTGTLDPPHMPPEWVEEHEVVRQLMEAEGRIDLALASRHDSDLANKDIEPVTDARHPDEFYPGASDYNFDIDDYCISRGGVDEMEAEQMILEAFHRERMEEDRRMLENRERARFEMELIRERAMAEGERRGLVRESERVRTPVNPFDAVLEEWANLEWPDERVPC